MGPRDPKEPGRVSTPLELLFDLVFAIWWAWLNYTWFASA
jgi:hypothetical protein